MEIKDVQLNHHPAIEAGTEIGSNGQPLAIAPQPETFGFVVTLEDGTTFSVPNDVENRHYWEIKAWYDAQETKPFDFTFEVMPEPVFAETIYPPEPEETEETDQEAEQLDTPVTPEEPETLMPR